MTYQLAAKAMAIMFAVAAFFTGLWAARLWYRSSVVPIDPGWGMPGDTGTIEPVDDSAKALGWASATLISLQKVGDLNRKAAFWTAVTIVLGTVGAVVGNFA